MFVTSLLIIIEGGREQLINFYLFICILEQIDKIWFTRIYYRIENLDAKIVMVMLERVHGKGA